jgi:hypothetical protein
MNPKININIDQDSRNYLDAVKQNLRSMIFFARKRGENPLEAFKHKMAFFEEGSREHIINEETFEYLLETEDAWTKQFPKIIK